MNEYYVYVYLDNRKPGKYEYSDGLTFDYEPIYIGKGKNNRYLQHLTAYKRNKIKNIFYKKLYNIINEGYEPVILKIKENISHNDALNLEKYYIKLIGRISNNNGTLTNLTDGGDGTCGYHLSEETKNKIATKNLGRKQKYKSTEFHPMKYKSFDEYFGNEKSNEIKEKISKVLKEGKAPWKDKHIPEDMKERISNTLKEYYKNKENHPRYGKHLSEESKLKMSKSKKEYYKNNPHKKNHTIKLGEENPSFTVYKILNNITNELIELRGRDSVINYIMNYKKDNNILPKRSPSHVKLLLSKDSFPFVFISKGKINKGKGKYCRKNYDNKV